MFASAACSRSQKPTAQSNRGNKWRERMSTQKSFANQDTTVNFQKTVDTDSQTRTCRPAVVSMLKIPANTTHIIVCLHEYRRLQSPEHQTSLPRLGHRAPKGLLQGMGRSSPSTSCSTPGPTASISWMLYFTCSHGLRMQSSGHHSVSVLKAEPLHFGKVDDLGAP